MPNPADTDAAIADLTAKVTALTTVEDSADALLAGLKEKLDAALVAAANAGATPAQLASITALSTSIQTGSDKLSAAVTANTPAA